MSDQGMRALPLMLAGLVVTAIAGAVAWTVFAASDVPDAPVPIVWDKAACDCCGMHVGEPAFAAQVTTRSGRSLVFDDPGCLFLHLDEHHPAVHRVWFHHLREDRWLAEDAVAFVRVEPTPMGFGFGAVDRGEPGSSSLEEVRKTCLERGGRGGRSGRPNEVTPR